jgi:hypothetical protein
MLAVRKRSHEKLVAGLVDYSMRLAAMALPAADVRRMSDPGMNRWVSR